MSIVEKGLVVRQSILDDVVERFCSIPRCFSGFGSRYAISTDGRRVKVVVMSRLIVGTQIDFIFQLVQQFNLCVEVTK